MSIIAWIVIGLICGGIGSKLIDNRRRGISGNIIGGILGAVLGGLLFKFAGASSVMELNLYRILIAVTGFIVLLWGLYNYWAKQDRRSSTNPEAPSA